MNRTLHEADNAQRILKLTADTMLLVDRNGICIDIDIHSNLWFLQEERLLGKNIFDRMPEHTREKVYSTFQTVLREQRSISKNYKLELEDNTYYFKCIMYPYDDMVPCQYRDITQRSNVKRQLEQVNRNLREIQKVAQIGQWMYNTRPRQCLPLHGLHRSIVRGIFQKYLSGEISGIYRRRRPHEFHQLVPEK